MLEIFLVIALSRKIHSMAKEKGHGGALYVVLFVILWFVGEVAGAVIGAIASEGEPGLAVYLFALFGAAAGAAISFIIVSSLPSIKSDTGYDDERRGRLSFDDRSGSGGRYGERFEDRKPQAEDGPGYQAGNPTGFGYQERKADDR
jgi:hypothetical protein